MPRFHNINGIKVQFTAEEEAATDIEEQAWIDDTLNRDLLQLRRTRNNKLLETDFYALSDVTLTAEMGTYRQDLRDLPSGLDTVEKVANVTWPTKP